MRTIIILITGIILNLFINLHLLAEEPVSGQQKEIEVLKEQLDDVKVKFDTMQKEYQERIKTLEERIDGIREKNIEECLINCEYHELCHSGCMSNAFGSTSNIMNKDP